MTSLGFKRGWTQFPNSLIDLYMPKLTDTEWRVLVVIVRQTLGWQHQQSGKRRLRECLSHRQLKRQTGRHSAAISGAIERLSFMGLVTVRESSGAPLNSPSERRRAKATLYFELAPWIHSFSTATPQTEQKQTSETEDNKRYWNKRKNKETPGKPDDGFTK